MIAPAVTVLVIACALSLVLTTMVRCVAPRLGLVDRPDGRRKLHGTETALGGGVAIFLATGAVVGGMLLVPNPWREELLLHWPPLLAMWLAGAVLVIVGIADDRFGLRGRQKLAGQIVAALILTASGLVIERIGLFGMHVELGLLAVPVTLFWLLGATNAINLLDGIDGMAAIVGCILSCTIAAMGAITNHIDVAVVAMVFAGSLLGFLRFNFPPAQVFLGDAGSMLIGLVVGALAIRGSLKGPGTVLLAAPLAILIIPILDSTAAIIRRRLTGRSIYCTDRGHLHHRLLEKLGSNQKVLLWVGAGCGFTSAGALISVFLKNDLVAMVSCLSLLAIFIVSGMFGRSEAHLVAYRFRDFGLSLIRPASAESPRASEESIHLQGSHPWSLLWETLRESADKLSLNGLWLDVNLPVVHEGFHASWQRGSRDDPEQCWRMDFPLTAGDQPAGRLRIVGERNGQSVCQMMEQLVGLVEPFETRLSELARQEATQHRPEGVMVPSSDNGQDDAAGPDPEEVGDRSVFQPPDRPR